MIEVRTNCRSCDARLTEVVVDLGVTPLANSYLSKDGLAEDEPVFPLELMVCSKCWLVQLRHEVDPTMIFEDYAYFSSISNSWLSHSEEFAESMVSSFGLGSDSLVVEVASNDGYLLRSFQSRGIPVLGIEPAVNVAESAIESGVPTTIAFLSTEIARDVVNERGHPDLLVGNNVLAHVPNINGFVESLAYMMSSRTLLTMEFPHVLNLIGGTQFDTIYHEHYSYLSLLAVEALFERHGIRVVDVEQIPTHGGSLRIHARKRDMGAITSQRVHRLRKIEIDKGLSSTETYLQFESRVNAVKDSFVSFLHRAQAHGHSVAAYGAAAKGNTLLNTCRVDSRLIDFVVDRSQYKQGLYLPGSRIPIVAPDRVFANKPDYLVILPWNIAPEVTSQMAAIREWGGQFVVPIPTTRVVP